MKRKSYVFVLALVAANFALFLPAMRGGFFWDDKILISENPYLAGPDFWRTFLTAPFTGPSGWDRNSAALDRRVPFYRPLTALSYRIDLEIWGFNPAAFHLTNILLQTINAVLFFFIIVRFGLGVWPAFFGGILFSVFPLHFESVGWISGRTDLLAFALAAAALLCVIRSRSGRRGLWLALAAVFFFFALMAKESVILLPGIFFLILFLPGRLWKPALTGLAVCVPPLLVWAVLRSAAIGPPAAVLSLKSAGRTLSALGYYAYKLVFPFRLGLTVDAGRVFGNPAASVFGVLLAAFIVGSWLVLFKRGSASCRRWRKADNPARGDGSDNEIASDSPGDELKKGRKDEVVAAGADSNIEIAGDSPGDELKKRRRDEVAAAGAAFGLLAFPALLVIVSPSAESFMAWRFMYLASGLMVLAFVWAAFRFIRKNVAAVLLAALSVLYVIELYPKIRLYAKEEATIWLAIRNPEREDALARLNIGLDWLSIDEERGLAILRSLRDEKWRPNAETLKVRVAEELAAHYTRLKDTAKAAPYYNEILRSGASPSTYFYLNYAIFLALSGRPAEGEKIVARILDLFPENHMVLLNAARFYAVIGDNEKAAEFLKKDYALFPSPQTLEELRALDILKK